MLWYIEDILINMFKNSLNILAVTVLSFTVGDNYITICLFYYLVTIFYFIIASAAMSYKRGRA